MEYQARRSPARLVAGVEVIAQQFAQPAQRLRPAAKPCRERKKVEMLFAHLKRILRLGRLRLRGPNGAKDEFLLAATAQNLRKMAKLIPLPAPVFATWGGDARLCLADSRRWRISRSPEDAVFNEIDV
jgi:hypothetical protein